MTTFKKTLKTTSKAANPSNNSAARTVDTGDINLQEIDLNQMKI